MFHEGQETLHHPEVLPEPERRKRAKLLPHPEDHLLGVEPDNEVVTTGPLVDGREDLEVVPLL